MKFYKFILFAVVALAFNACNQSPAKKEADANVKYFRGIQFSETPFSVSQGVSLN